MAAGVLAKFNIPGLYFYCCVNILLCQYRNPFVFRVSLGINVVMVCIIPILCICWENKKSVGLVMNPNLILIITVAVLSRVKFYVVRAMAT